ncbi:MAG: hypothetical protein CBC20_02250, partial [Verrucomicrobia bacterium TMED60]
MENRVLFFICIIMKSKTIRFLSFLFPCLFACSIGHAYEQDNWYLAKEFGSLSTNSYGPAGITIYEGSNIDERKIFVCDQGAGKVASYDFNGSLLFTIDGLPKVKGVAVSKASKIFCLFQSGIKSYQIDGTFIGDIAGSGSGDG